MSLDLSDITMYQICDILGLDYSQRKADEYFFCPDCDIDGRKKHLNINYRKGTFKCVKCDQGGGKLGLYMFYTGCPSTKQAYREIAEKIGGSEEFTKRVLKAQTLPPETDEYPLNDVDTRHRTYSELLSRLTLFDKHRNNLRDRGLTDDEINNLGYKSVPLINIKNVIREIQMVGCQFQGVPGFYRMDNGDWNICFPGNGIIIPYRDIDGKIQGFQVRLDKPVDAKYKWISSVNMNNGTKSGTFVHMTPFDSSMPVYLTEGALKADIIHMMTDANVIAVPGVNSLKFLPEALAELKEKGVYEIKICYDIDRFVNPHVKKGLEKIKKILDDLDFQYSDMIWNPWYKGFDDFLTRNRREK